MRGVTKVVHRQLRITWHLPAVLGALTLLGASLAAWPWLTSSAPRVVHLRGSHYEIGLQHGTQLRSEIRALYDAYVLGGIVEKEGHPLARLLASAKRYEPYIAVTLRDEMRGIAHGSGLTYDEILVMNTFADALLGRGRACSAAAVHGRDGILVARNLDWVNHGVAHRSGIIFLLEPTGGRRVLSVGWPGMAGVVSGMNDAGLVATMNMAFADDLQPDAAPALLRLRELLERESTPAQAAERLAATPRTIAMNVLLAAPSDALVVELSGEAYAIRPMTNGCVVTTNHYEALPFRGGFGGDRTATLRGALSGGGTVSPLALQWSLLRVSMLGSGEGLATIQSVIFDPASKTARVAIGKLPAPLGRFYEVGFTASPTPRSSSVRSRS